MIKVVAFDLYGTLIHFKEVGEPKDEVLSHILQEAGYDVYYQEMQAARQFVGFIDYPRGRANTPYEYFSKVLERLEIAQEENLINKLVRKNADLDKLLLYEDVHPTIEALRAQGIKTAIVTTIAAWRFVPFLSQNEVYIDFICTANEAHAVKPDPKIYSAILEKFGVRAEEALMVGDDVKTDTLPAKRVGLRTALLCRGEKVKGVDADHVISSLTELLTLLKS
jgi:HAD superfamily hydrolase (TIGR01662 family)